MCSYNQINNSYSSQNSWTLNYLLKNELDFQGFVTSDWWAQHDGVASTLAGLDMTMAGDQNLASGNTYWGTNLTNAVLNGTIPQWRLDDMVVRIMSAFFKVGRDTARVPVNFNSWTLKTTGYLHPEAEEDFQQVNWHINVQDDHAALIREIGGASTVLLKNTNDALPLNKPKSIAVIGEDSHDNPGGPNACSDRGCDIGTLAMGWGSGIANFPYLIAPVTALRAQAAHDHSAFTNVSDNYDFEAVRAAVTGAEVTIVFGNADSGEDYITVDGNQGDRNNLTLWGDADALIDFVASTNPNTVDVMHTVGPVIVEAYKNNPNVTAILWAGLPGQESGNALTDVLYGNANPQAKSALNWGKKREDWGTDVLYNSTQDPPQLNFVEGVFIAPATLMPQASSLATSSALVSATLRLPTPTWLSRSRIQDHTNPLLDGPSQHRHLEQSTTIPLMQSFLQVSTLSASSFIPIWMALSLKASLKISHLVLRMARRSR